MRTASRRACMPLARVSRRGSGRGNWAVWRSCCRARTPRRSCRARRVFYTSAAAASVTLDVAHNVAAPTSAGIYRVFRDASIKRVVDLGAGQSPLLRSLTVKEINALQGGGVYVLAIFDAGHPGGALVGRLGCAEQGEGEGRGEGESQGQGEDVPGAAGQAAGSAAAAAASPAPQASRAEVPDQLKSGEGEGEGEGAPPDRVVVNDCRFTLTGGQVVPASGCEETADAQVRITLYEDEVWGWVGLSHDFTDALEAAVRYGGPAENGLGGGGFGRCFESGFVCYQYGRDGAAVERAGLFRAAHAGLSFGRGARRYRRYGLHGPGRVFRVAGEHFGGGDGSALEQRVYGGAACD